MKKVLLILVLLLSFISVNASETKYKIGDKFVYETSDMAIEGYVDEEHYLNVNAITIDEEKVCNFYVWFFPDEEGSRLYQYDTSDDIILSNSDRSKRVLLPYDYYEEANYYMIETNCNTYYQTPVIENETTTPLESGSSIPDVFLLIVGFMILMGITITILVVLFIIKVIKYSMRGPISEEDFRSIMSSHLFNIADITSEFPGAVRVLRATNNDNVEFTYYLMPSKDSVIFTDNFDKQLGSKSYKDTNKSSMNSFGSSTFVKKNGVGKSVSYGKFANSSLFAVSDFMKSNEANEILKEFNFYLFGNKKKK